MTREFPWDKTSKSDSADDKIFKLPLPRRPQVVTPEMGEILDLVTRSTSAIRTANERADSAELRGTTLREHAEREVRALVARARTAEQRVRELSALLEEAELRAEAAEARARESAAQLDEVHQVLSDSLMEAEDFVSSGRAA